MSAEKITELEAEQYDPRLDAQDEELLSGGNNRLMYVLVGLIVALVIGYIALPKGQGSALATVVPSFMLDDAAVTATLPTAADSIAAGLKAAPAPAVAATATPSLSKPAPANRLAPAVKPAPATATRASEPAAAPAAPAAAAAAPAPVAVAAAPAAPAALTITGKIDDENGRPLVGATVLLKGSSKGTSTDANGNYSLEVPTGTESTLIYGYGGYDDEVMRVRNSQPVNVTLTPQAKAGKRRR